MHLDLLNQRLAAIAKGHKRVLLALSLGAEDMLLLHQIDSLGLGIGAFVLDTGRLHEESYGFLDKVQERYKIEIVVYAPKRQPLEAYYAKHGLNAFYRSVALRKQCCHIRKVEPLARALINADAWITGQRRSQSVARSGLATEEKDAAQGITKYNPLAELDTESLWRWVTRLGVMTHPLHGQGMPSIGCAPCTRAIKSDEDERAGRWWWETSGARECGLHR